MIDTDDEYIEEIYIDDYDYKYFDESDSDDDDYIEEGLRVEAKRRAEEADDNFRHYRDALKIGDGEMAKNYHDAAKYGRKCMKDANDRAADIAFERNNENRPFHIIDLHHLFVTEAIAKLTDRVNDAIIRSMQELTVIVGRGRHSVCGPKLKTAVANYAFKNNIRFGLDPINPGRIELYLEDASPIRSHESESETHSDSSIYIYNRSNEATLSDYITQTLPKKQRRKPSKNRKNTPHRADHRRDKVSSLSGNTSHTQQNSSNHIQLNVEKSQKNLKQKKRKCNAQNINACSNEMPSSENTLQFKRVDSTYISQQGTGSVDLKKPSKNATQRDEVSSSVTPQTQQKDSTHKLLNVKESQINVKQKKRKCNAQNVNTSQLKRKDSTHILLNVNEFENRLNEFCSSICNSVFVLIGVMLIARLFGL